ncbi:hypothetical protein AKJ65_01035 [candidate division MSBL1 archaeon SCGC-AAA259E19]|uniref:Orotidine 5'-phosphate decarboxylase n=1 Tax=candidate division MSBL1 archaeon SCGC-AAA259E19 TaxID=1698264 RepID=A0A133UN83_9EURY|nr:hypothetical protein AKJ65_01035 [candidate division MSBL1 archaeon SCGC-AAA259E19]
MVGERFRSQLTEKSRENNSKLILALDVAEGDVEKEGIDKKYLNILAKAKDSIAAVKIGYPLVLETNLEILTRAKKRGKVPVIADFKIADIPYTNRQITRSAYRAGADGVIAHAFVGQDSLEAVVQATREEGGRGVIVLPAMSHEGGKMFIQPVSNKMLELAKKVKATGIIGPATRPEDVENLRTKAGKDLLIFTPGIGAQGAMPGDAIRCGADYEIVGRAIYTSENPKKEAEKIRKKINKRTENLSR